MRNKILKYLLLMKRYIEQDIGDVPYGENKVKELEVLISQIESGCSLEEKLCDHDYVNCCTFDESGRGIVVFCIKCGERK